MKQTINVNGGTATLEVPDVDDLVLLAVLHAMHEEFYGVGEVVGLEYDEDLNLNFALTDSEEFGRKRYKYTTRLIRGNWFVTMHGRSRKVG